MPSRPGTYALLLALDQAATITVGRLGTFTFPAGVYVYVGSALGPGGLAGRLRRQIAAGFGRALHWHVDYLRRATRLEAIWFRCHEQRAEHDWARAMQHLSGVSIPAPRFGASDCRCPSHLFHFPNPPGPDSFQAHLTN